MQLLPVAAFFDARHEQVFRRQKRQRVREDARVGGFVYDQAGSDVRHEAEDCVGCQKRFRQREPAVGGVVQRAFHPLRTCGERRVLRGGHYKPCERADALRTHGVLLVRHGGRADLAGFERLRENAVVLQQAHVAAEAVGTLSHAGKRVEDAAVELARVGLPGDVVEFAKAEIRRDSAVELVNLIRVPAKERNKARFRACSTPAAQKADGGKRVRNLFQIEE